MTEFNAGMLVGGAIAIATWLTLCLIERVRR